MFPSSRNSLAVHLRDHLIVCQLFELITIQRMTGGFSHYTASYTMHYTYSLPLHLYPNQLSRLVTARYLLILVQKYKIISSHHVGAHSGPSLEFLCVMQKNSCMK